MNFVLRDSQGPTQKFASREEAVTELYKRCADADSLVEAPAEVVGTMFYYTSQEAADADQTGEHARFAIADLTSGHAAYHWER